MFIFKKKHALFCGSTFAVCFHNFTWFQKNDNKIILSRGSGSGLLFHRGKTQKDVIFAKKGVHLLQTIRNMLMTTVVFRQLALYGVCNHLFLWCFILQKFPSVFQTTVNSWTHAAMLPNHFWPQNALQCNFHRSVCQRWWLKRH